ncbi:MAG: NAD-dependent epimerase/dehydratase family protein [Thermoproteota archaeon]
MKNHLRDPALYFKNNVAGTVNIADACLREGVKLLVYISSAAVYGDLMTPPINENKPRITIWLIEAVKLYGKHGLKYVILRLFKRLHLLPDVKCPSK